VTGGSDLKVDLLVQTAFGPFDVPLADFADHPGRTWSATGKLTAPNGLAIPAGMSIQGALRFTVPSSSGAWQIDDVYVDPYRSA
jgi:hypothetical protein